MSVLKIRIKCCDSDRINKIEIFDMMVGKDKTGEYEQIYVHASHGCNEYTDRECCIKCMERFVQLCKDFTTGKEKFKSFEAY